MKFKNMDEAVKNLLGPIYYWDAAGELGYNGHPLSGHWQTDYEKKMVKLAAGSI